MKSRKKGLLMGIAAIMAVALVFAGYQIYRYPAMFRNPSDGSLTDSQVAELREEILSRPNRGILVAYFSYSGTTRGIANAISEKTGGDLFEITPQEGYSNVYLESNSEVRRNERPALADTVENMEEYDIVFVGFPVWWHATPAPVNTFLESYDLTGKLIIPFCTSGGSDIDEIMPTFLHSCDGLAVYGERRISGTGQLDGWLSELGVTSTGEENQPEQTGQEEAGTEEFTEQSTGETSAGVVQDTDTQITDDTIFEYEIRELPAQRDGNHIYGVAYVPLDAGEQMPVVIYAHGYGVTHQNGIQYAERLAEHGYVVYCFDFCGGGGGSRSDGSPLEMSIFTEQADLEAVIGMVKKLDFVDSENVFLFGASQGGLVAGITAAANPEDIQGLILLYPGFEIVEDAQALFASADEIPETYSMFGWMSVGRTYFEDLPDYDVYSVIGAYEKDVLLIHGDADGIVPISSSERALEVYPSAELKVLPGAGHGLHGQDAETATEYMLEYLHAHCR